jgi:hypothetical protein
MVHQQEGDHYQILQHAMGLIDLNATEEGRSVLWRYNADADLAGGGIAQHKADGRIIDPGEVPPSHLNDEERAYWLNCQSRGDLYAPSTVAPAADAGGTE